MNFYFRSEIDQLKNQVNALIDLGETSSDTYMKKQSLIWCKSAYHELLGVVDINPTLLDKDAEKILNNIKQNLIFLELKNP